MKKLWVILTGNSENDDFTVSVRLTKESWDIIHKEYHLFNEASAVTDALQSLLENIVYYKDEIKGDDPL